MEQNETFMNQLVLAQNEITAFVASLLPFHRDAVADIVQETNLALVAEAARFDASRPFLPWVFTFAKHQVQRYLKEQQRGRVLFSSELIDKLAEIYADDSCAEAETPERQGLLARLRFCRGKLKERERLLLALFYDQQMPLKQIASHLKRPEPSLRVTLSGIRGKLGHCLRNLCQLSDAEFEHRGGEPLGAVVDCAIYGDAPSERQLREAAARCGTLDDAALRDVLDQFRVDALLRGPARPHPSASAGLSWRRLLPLAACLAVLAGGGVWLAQRHKGRILPPVAAQSPSAVAFHPVQQRNSSVQAQPQPIPKHPVAQNPSALPAPRHTEQNVVSVVPSCKKNETNETQGEKPMRKQTALAVAAAGLALAPAASVKAATSASSSYADSAIQIIDTRDGDTGTTATSVVETRDFSESIDSGKTIDTSKPLGTVIMLI